MKKLKIILMGSGALACPLLDGIVNAGRDELAAVVTQPDRAGGRGLHCMACDVKRLAEARGMAVLSPADASGDAFVARLAALEPDLLIVACYGQFLRSNLLAVPRLGTINVHPSMLPKYRGASPIQWALANGDRETGVSVLFVTPKMDAGDLLAQERFPIDPDDTAETLEPKLARKGAELLLGVLDRFRSGTPQAVPQDESAVTFACKLVREDGRVDWSMPAERIRNRLRGFYPWPGAFTTLPDGSLLKIHAMEVEAGAGGASPGTVLSVGESGLLVAAGTGAVRLTRVQPEGRKAMDAEAWLRGARLPPGAGLGLKKE